MLTRKEIIFIDIAITFAHTPLFALFVFLFLFSPRPKFLLVVRSHLALAHRLVAVLPSLQSAQLLLV